MQLKKKRILRQAAEEIIGALADYPTEELKLVAAQLQPDDEDLIAGFGLSEPAASQQARAIIRDCPKTENKLIKEVATHYLQDVITCAGNLQRAYQNLPTTNAVLTHDPDQKIDDMVMEKLIQQSLFEHQKTLLEQSLLTLCIEHLISEETAFELVECYQITLSSSSAP